MKNVFEEIRIGTLVLKNRLVRAATWENMADENGHMTEKLFRLYDDLAQGGIGMIITGCTYVMPDDQFYPGMMGASDDSFVPEYRRLTDMVHRHGVRIIQQLAYGGSQGTHRTENRTIWGPSEVTDLATGTIPTPITKTEIKILVKAFGAAALRAKSAGFDGVEIHGAHGYLLGQFLSPYYNRRNDEYGGSIDNRARVFLEIYEEIRNRVGSYFSVMIKINSCDFIEGGATFEDCLYVCRKLAERGINAIEISGGTAASGEFISKPQINNRAKEGYHAAYAAKIADEVQAPIILVGGLRSLEALENYLETTKIELFSLARPLLAEPDLPQRWQQGISTRAKCVSCNACLRMPEGGNVCVLKHKL